MMYSGLVFNQFTSTHMPGYCWSLLERWDDTFLPLTFYLFFSYFFLPDTIHGRAIVQWHQYLLSESRH